MILKLISDYSLIFIIEIVCCFFLLYISNIILTEIKFFDYPSERKIHNEPVTPSGGIALFISFLIISFLFYFDTWLLYLIISSTLIVIIGLIDDKIGLGIKIRVFTQLVSCLIILSMNVYISDLDQIFGLQFKYDFILGMVFTIICVIAYTNASNFIDGYDGLASTNNIIIYVSILILLILNNQISQINFSLMIIIGLIIFTFFNLTLFKLPKIFLGDCGSTFIGFISSWYLIYLHFNFPNIFKPTIIIWLISIGFFDFLRVIISRLFRKKDFLNPELNHIHHILDNILGDKRLVLIFILILQIFLISFGFFLNIYIDNMYTIYFIYIGTFFVYYYIFENFSHLKSKK